MEEVNLLITAANKRVRESNPEYDKKGRPKPVAKKKSMDEFLEENKL